MKTSVRFRGQRQIVGSYSLEWAQAIGKFGFSFYGRLLCLTVILNEQIIILALFTHVNTSMALPDSFAFIEFCRILGLIDFSDTVLRLLGSMAVPIVIFLRWKAFFVNVKIFARWRFIQILL